MSDQGYPGTPGYGGQQPPFGGQPEYGQQPPYDPGQPPQFPQQPPYDPNQTAQFPQQPPYDPNQGAPYGQPVYPGGDYAQPPQYGGPGGPGGPPQYPGAPPTGSGGGRRGLLVAAVVAVLAALGVGAFFLFSGSDSASASPADAAKALLDAGKNNDLGAAKKALCESDLAAGIGDQLDQSGRVVNYTIGKTVNQGADRATVSVTFTTQRGGTQTQQFPVVKQNGDWKVCFTGSGGPGPGPGPSDFPSVTGAPTIPIPSVSLPSISLPPISNLPSVPSTNPCAFISDASTVATVYVGAAEIGETDVAQACVFEDSVPRSVTESLATTGEGLFAPTGSHGSAFEYASIDGKTRLTVTVTKESDGNFYVTGLQRVSN